MQHTFFYWISQSADKDVNHVHHWAELSGEETPGAQQCATYLQTLHTICNITNSHSQFLPAAPPLPAMEPWFMIGRSIQEFIMNLWWKACYLQTVLIWADGKVQLILFQHTKCLATTGTVHSLREVDRELSKVRPILQENHNKKHHSRLIQAQLAQRQLCEIRLSL